MSEPKVLALFDEDKDRRILMTFKNNEPDYYGRSERIMNKLNEIYRILNLLAENEGI